MFAFGSLPYVTDGGLETDLMFHHGIDLPEFAAYPLVASHPELLRQYYDGYADVAERVDAGLLLEAPTWRANPDWGDRLGHDKTDLANANHAAIALMHRLRDAWSRRIPDIRVVGMIGPRGDAYAGGPEISPDDAQAYHRPQVLAFARAGVDLAAAYTLNDPGEAIGIVRAADEVGIPVSVSFTVETDGRLPNGLGIAEAIALVDAVAPPSHFLLNCAHPSHFERALGLGDGLGLDRIRGIRANASRLSHAELDEATTLDEGDLADLCAAHDPLLRRLPELAILGGCCGTDARHIQALWSGRGPGATLRKQAA